MYIYLISAGAVCLFRTSEYADDAAVSFTSRADADTGIKELIAVFNKFGMEVHTGTAEKPSKSVVLYSSPGSAQDDNQPDLSPFQFDNNTQIPIVPTFAYLGSTIDSSSADHADITARINAASRSFGALRKPIFSNRFISRSAKVAIYSSIVLPIALYGSECWALTAADEHVLEVFHNKCIRAICNTTKWTQRTYHISSEILRKRLNLPKMSLLLIRRQLRWAGHVSRMKPSRLPRKMMTAWCQQARPRGGPKFTFGRSLKKALGHVGLDLSNWSIAASDRKAWRALIKNVEC